MHIKDSIKCITLGEDYQERETAHNQKFNLMMPQTPGFSYTNVSTVDCKVCIESVIAEIAPPWSSPGVRRTRAAHMSVIGDSGFRVILCISSKPAESLLAL